MTPILTIIRDRAGDNGTFGKVFVNGRHIAETLELPWRNNQPYISCIPCGIYTLTKRRTWFNAKNLGHTFEVCPIPNRTAILIHPGNTVEDLKGCIAPGMTRGRLGDLPAVLSSREAFNRVIALCGDSETALLIIKEVGPCKRLF